MVIWVFRPPFTLITHRSLWSTMTLTRNIFTFSVHHLHTIKTHSLHRIAIRFFPWISDSSHTHGCLVWSRSVSGKSIGGAKRTPKSVQCCDVVLSCVSHTRASEKNSNLMDEFLFKFLSSPPHTELATHNMIQERICNNKIQKLRETSERTVCIIWIGHTTQHSTDGRVECSRFNGRLMETFSRDIIHPCVVILELLSGCAGEFCVESVQMKFTFLMYSWKCVHN